MENSQNIKSNNNNKNTQNVSDGMEEENLLMLNFLLWWANERKEHRNIDNEK